MIGIIKARGQVKAIHVVIDTMMPDLKSPDDSDAVVRVAAALVELRQRAARAEQELGRLRHKYEPTRERAKLLNGTTVVQPVGMVRAG